MSTELEDLYFEWLYSKVKSTKVVNPKRTHWSFLFQLHEKDYIWFIPNDDNRYMDGVALRGDFLAEHNVSKEVIFMHDRPCTMLELLIALAERYAFMAGGEIRDRFWRMIENLSLGDISDYGYDLEPELYDKVDDALDAIIWKTCEYDGSGGIFPLMHNVKDQRKVELWDQLCAYILEEEGRPGGLL